MKSANKVQLAGRVYLVENDWVVEDSTGEIRLVINGESDSFHPVLNRGRHENYKVLFIPIEQYADVVEVLQ